MKIEALLILMSLIATCGGITVALLMLAHADTARAADHVATINALACSRVDERARPTW